MNRQIVEREEAFVFGENSDVIASSDQSGLQIFIVVLLLKRLVKSSGKTTFWNKKRLSWRENKVCV